MHMGSLPIAPKQSLAQGGEQSRLMTDAVRLVQAGRGVGAGRGQRRQLCRRQPQKRLGSSRASSPVARGPAPPQHQ
uniref:Uncharacterized protein n=1 Tax=Rangifer tarandus platyrhynchus TaxID=3082113 RepID=A0ACB0DUK9_RANTA|nr:unnamed protein product [Rangifer tarandus platyrhynchus]